MLPGAMGAGATSGSGRSNRSPTRERLAAAGSCARRNRRWFPVDLCRVDANMCNRLRFTLKRTLLFVFVF